VIEGTTFRHPGLKIAFDAPAGFRLQNSPDAVAGSDGQGRFMVFDMASDVGGDLRGYLQQGWVTNQRLQDLQAVQLDQRAAAVGFGRVAIGGQPAQAMFAVADAGGGKAFRFVFGDRRGLDRQDVDAFERSLRSLRALPAAEAAGIRGHRIELVTVKAGDTVDSFVAQMQGVPDPRALFILLNGLDRGRALTPGDQVKVIRYAPAGGPSVARRASPPRSA
jgi:predicted Zn-dependent protease